MQRPHVLSVRAHRGHPYGEPCEDGERVRLAVPQIAIAGEMRPDRSV